MNAIDRLRFTDPGAREWLTEDATMLLQLAYQVQGPAALRCGREQAAIHEAGHAIVYFANGERLRSVRVFERHGSWLGMTSAGKRWRVAPETDPAKDLEQARAFLAGPFAEWFYAASPVFGAGVDEVAVARAIVDQAARKAGVDAEYLMIQTIALTVETMNRHRPALDEIARRLMRKPKLEGQRVEAIIRGSVEASARFAAGAAVDSGR
jgi:hypothetical protein